MGGSAPLDVAALLASLLLLMSATTTSAVKIAKVKSLCKVGNKEGAKEKYALYPSGQCATCFFGLAGNGNHCYNFLDGEYQQCLITGPDSYYTTINKGGYRHCVCGAGLVGKPIADATSPAPGATFGPIFLAGCDTCPSISTASTPGNNQERCGLCNRKQMFVGSPPFCEWQPTRFARNCVVPVAAGNFKKPAYYKGAFIPGTSKCGCAAGDYGTWPQCQRCPPGLSNPVGNRRTCTCDTKNGYLPVSKSKPASCKCDTARGYFPTRQNNTLCVKCSKVVGGAVVQVGKGTKMCGCDVKKGYGVNPAADGAPCLKCTTVGGTLDKARGWCRCKPGFGVDPLYGNTTNGYSTQKFCVSCSGPGMRVNSRGVCSCAPGYARDPSNVATKCIPCSGRKTPTTDPYYPQPLCLCKPAYSLLYNGTCDLCPAGASSSDGRYCDCPPNTDTSVSGCEKCRKGYVKNPKTKRCDLSAACRSSTWSLQYWSSAAIGPSWNGTAFPDFLLSNKVKPTKTVSLPSISTTFPSPLLTPTTRFAVVLEGYFLGRKVAPYTPPTGRGRYVPAAGLAVVSTGSRVTAPTDPTYYGVQGPVQSYFPKKNRAEIRVADLGMYTARGDECRYVRLLWWGSKKGASLVVKKITTRGQTPL